MGCCASRSAETVFVDVPTHVGTTEEYTLRKKSLDKGGQVAPFTAACPASYPYEVLTRVVDGTEYVFAAVFDGVGGSQAARHCINACHDVLMDMLKTSPPDAALRQTIQELERSYFASKLPDKVKATVGATGSLLYLQTTTNQCYVANIGNCTPFLTRSQGSFNNKVISAQYLTSDAKHRSPESWISGSPAAVQDKARVKETTTAGAKGASNAGSQAGVANEFDSSSSSSRCIGMGCGKTAAMHDVWLGTLDHQPKALPPLPFITTDCEVAVYQLAIGDECLVLSSEGLTGTVSPQEMATLLNHFDSGTLTMLQSCYLDSSPPPAQPGSRPASPAAAAASASSTAVAPRFCNVASIAMHHAMSKTIKKHNLTRDAMQSSLDFDRLQHLPLAVDLEAFRPLEASSRRSSEVKVHLSEGGASSGPSKRLIHRDMGVVVICCEWPSQELDFHNSAASHKLAARRACCSPRALYHWQLLRLLVRFRIARRRQLLAAWWAAVERMARLAEAEARAAEIRVWRTTGEAVQVTLTGQKLDPETPCSAGRPLPTPPRANLYRSPTTGGMQRTTSSSSWRNTASGDHATPTSASRRVTGASDHTTPSASRRMTGAGEITPSASSRHATPGSSRRVTGSGGLAASYMYEGSPGAGASQQQGQAGSGTCSRSASLSVRNSPAALTVLGTRTTPNDIAGIAYDEVPVGGGSARKREAGWSPAAPAAAHARTSGAGPSSSSNYQLRNSSSKGAASFYSSIRAAANSASPAAAAMSSTGFVDDEAIEVDMVESGGNRAGRAGEDPDWESEPAGRNTSSTAAHMRQASMSRPGQALASAVHRDGDRIPDAHIRSSSGGGGAAADWGKGSSTGVGPPFVTPVGSGASSRAGGGKVVSRSPSKNHNISLRNKQPGAL